MHKRKSDFFGYHNILKIYTYKRIRKALCWPFIFSIVIFPFLLFSEKESLFWVIKISDIILLLFPPLLGFSLGGYALIVGFTTPEFLKYITSQDSDSATLFQIINGTFAISILFQSVVLTIGFVVSLFASCDLSFDYAVYLNWITVFFLLWVSLWGISTIRNMVVNIFNFGQLRHYKQKKDIIIEEQYGKK